MLPKTNRLITQHDFDAVFEKGRGTKRDFLIIQFVKNTLPHSRFGFIVSKKVAPKAVDRNLIKRRLRSLITRHINNMKSSLDVVIIATPKTKGKTFEEFEKILNGFFTSL